MNDLEIPNNNTFPPCDIIGDIDHPIIVYPNPTNDNWNIKINATNKEEVLVTLKDNSGKIVYSKTIILNNIGENEFTINSNNLLKGAYLLEIKGKSIDMNRKLIKM
ncbi:MAG: T9SS type A sorting domain-containing protein [Bacteroidales bacterium]|nr:T9SS type A sorting domain-containing protein [Bacteroidales bacterium]